MVNDIHKLSFVKHKFKKQEFKKHFHDNYSIGLILNGLHKVQLEKKDMIVNQGEIKVLNPYDLHCADGNITWEYINFMPDETLINSIAQDMCDDYLKCKIRFENSIQDNIATRYFIDLYHSIEHKIEYEENFILFVSYLLKNYSSKSIQEVRIPANIKHSVDYIHSYFLDDISLDVIAQLSGLSKYHFIKVFKEKTGLTPHQYIVGLRVEHGMKMIQQNIPLSIVAQECNFSDQSHFIRTFKTHYGFTPSLAI